MCRGGELLRRAGLTTRQHQACDVAPFEKSAQVLLLLVRGAPRRCGSPACADRLLDRVGHRGPPTRGFAEVAEPRPVLF